MSKSVYYTDAAINNIIDTFNTTYTHLNVLKWVLYSMNI